MDKRVVFQHKTLPYLLLAPQLIVTFVFFFWPAGQALWQSFHLDDPFGFSASFVGLQNFQELLADSSYRRSFWVTAQFAFWVAILGSAVSRLLAVMANGVLRAATCYSTLLLCPYGVATAVACVLW